MNGRTPELSHDASLDELTALVARERRARGKDYDVARAFVLEGVRGEERFVEREAESTF